MSYCDLAHTFDNLRPRFQSDSIELLLEIRNFSGRRDAAARIPRFRSLAFSNPLELTTRQGGGEDTFNIVFLSLCKVRVQKWVVDGVDQTRPEGINANATESIFYLRDREMALPTFLLYLPYPLFRKPFSERDLLDVKG